jgi:lipopolysaccharide transport system ATP-binding protein
VSVAIQSRGLGKRYRIGARQRGYRTLRESIVEAAGAPLRWMSGEYRAAAPAETIWAFRDISFDVQPGEVVGLVGRNGAGKSTLLKVLSRITEPTEGVAEIHGRVGSLLEVGMGFHPELTGRENIFLMGAILGMKRAETQRNLDSIIAFAEIDQFADTPVKRYSSGMFLRLAFAVAAHLETEILLVDEVLAVGDVFFQKKCLGKIGEIARAGRTVFFVSHNMSAVQNLCTRGICLRPGQVAVDGPISTVVDEYLRTLDGDMHLLNDELDTAPRPTGLGLAGRLKRARIEGLEDLRVPMWAPLRIRVDFEAREDLRNLSVGYSVLSMDGGLLFSCESIDASPPLELPTGESRSAVGIVEHPNLAPGHYEVSVRAREGPRVIDSLERVLTFEVAPFGISAWTKSDRQFRPRSEWTIDE